MIAFGYDFLGEDTEDIELDTPEIDFDADESDTEDYCRYCAFCNLYSCNSSQYDS